MEKRVAVTGLGVLSCIGNDVNTFWNNLKDGVCGIDYITEFPTDGLAVKIAGTVKNFNPEDFGMDKPFIRKQDPFTLFAMASASQAMADSGLVSGENVAPDRLGVYVGSGIGGFTTIFREVGKMIEDPLSEKLLAREFRAGDTINAKKVGDALEFARKLPAKRKRTGAHVPTSK